MVATVPIYLSEISAPEHRGLIGGISGCGISFGTMMSNWVGMACGYAKNGTVQWRLPLGLQIPWGIIMFIGLATFMPNSPRQLLRHGRVEEARIEFVKIRRDLQSHEVHEEFALMRAQIEYELEREVTSYKEIFRLFRHRALVSIAVQTMTSLTGVNVIQYYQSTSFGSFLEIKLTIYSYLIQVSRNRFHYNPRLSRCIRHRGLSLQCHHHQISDRSMGSTKVSYLTLEAV